MHLPEGVHATYGVVTADKDVAKEYIDFIKDREKASGNNVEKFIFGSYDIECIMQNGTRIIWVKPNDSARGYRLAKVYIDLATISLECLREEILPKCIFADKEDYVTFYSKDIKDVGLISVIKELQKSALIYGDVGVIREDSEFGEQMIHGIDSNIDRVLLW